jgi:hypothetical protein
MFSRLLGGFGPAQTPLGKIITPAPATAVDRTNLLREIDDWEIDDWELDDWELDDWELESLQPFDRRVMAKLLLGGR